MVRLRQGRVRDAAPVRPAKGHAPEAPPTTALQEPASRPRNQRRVLDALEDLGGDADYLEVRNRMQVRNGAGINGTSFGKAVDALAKDGEIRVYEEGTRRRLRLLSSSLADRPAFCGQPADSKFNGTDTTDTPLPPL
jgi:hypothetical protein